MTGAAAERGAGTRAWLGLALGVLALAGLLAVLLGLARSPWLGDALPGSYFRVALVVHVDLLLVVWYLVIPVLLWRLAGVLEGRWERPAFWLMAAGVAGMTVPGVAGWGRPAPVNYVPFLVQPLFLGGLAVFLAGVGVAAARGVRGLGRAEPVARAAGAGAACVLAALAALAVTAARLAATGGWGEEGLGTVFWVGGHLLQFAHTGLMLAALALLLPAVAPPLARLVLLLLPGAAAGLAGALLLSPAALAGGPFLVTLKSWGVGVPGALAVPVAAAGWWRARGARGPERAAAGAALLLLAAGGAVAVLGDLGRQSTLIPGHYHAVLTAVALAFMGVTYAVLEREGVALPLPRWAAWQPYLYGLGTLVLVAGMVWAGVHGAPRKTPGVAWAADPAVLLALSTWGAGTLLSFAGAVGYLVNMAGAVGRWRRAPSGRPRGPATARV